MTALFDSVAIPSGLFPSAYAAKLDGKPRAKKRRKKGRGIFLGSKKRAGYRCRLEDNYRPPAGIIGVWGYTDKGARASRTQRDHVRLAPVPETPNDYKRALPHKTADALRLRRLEAGYTARQLATELGISRSTITHLERSRRPLNLSKQLRGEDAALIKICRGLGIEDLSALAAKYAGEPVGSDGQGGQPTIHLWERWLAKEYPSACPFAKAVRAARVARNLSIKQLAGMIGCSVAMVGNLERSAANPTHLGNPASYAARLAAELEVDITPFLAIAPLSNKKGGPTAKTAQITNTKE